MVEALKGAFPAIRKELADNAIGGLTHLEIAVFTRHTQQQIDQQDAAELDRCFRLAKQLWMDGDSDVRNAVAVSFLEDLHFEDGKRQRRWAVAHLPEPLKSVWRSVTGEPG